MAEQDPSTESSPIDDRYVVATFALWAGDLAYAELLFKEVASSDHPEDAPHGYRSPEELVRHVAARRQNQIKRRRAEVRSLLQDPDANLQTEILETRHMRGAVLRTGPRSFRVNAYLSDVTWESSLFEAATVFIEASREGAERSNDEREPSREQGVARGGRWVVTGEPFLQVRLTPLGQLVVDALFTGAAPPNDFKGQVRPNLRAAMLSLDPVE